MLIKQLFGTAAVLSFVAAGAMAQTAAPAPGDLPAPLAGLNLGNLEVETKRDGMREVEGRTADGVEIEARRYAATTPFRIIARIAVL